MSKITESAIITSHKDHRVSGIYMFENKSNGKVYIGQSTNLYQRYARHKRSFRVPDNYGRRLISAFRKYGFDNFNYYVLEYVETVNLTEREQFWMDKYKSYEKQFGYNGCHAAGSPVGYKHTEETKRKVSIASRGRRHSEETRKQMSIMHKGKIISDEAKKKNSEWHKGRKVENKKGVSVCQVDKLTNNVIQIFISASAAQKVTGINVSAILRVAHGDKKRKSAGGYYWRKP